MVIYPSVPFKMMAGVKLLSHAASRKRLGATERPLGPAGGPGWGPAGAVLAGVGATLLNLLRKFVTEQGNS